VIHYAAAAHADQPAVRFGAGTLGAAVSISQRIDPSTAIRFTYATFAFNHQTQFDNTVINVQTRLQLSEQFRAQSAGVYVDRFIRSPIYFTFGAVMNQNGIAAVSVPADSSILINHYVYSAAQAGVIFTNVKWIPVSPCAGFGFGPRLSDRRCVALVAQVGAYYESRANVSFAANGVIEKNEKHFANYFDTLRGRLARELSPVEIYPVVELGLRLRM
jgi:hypothetical protein